MCVCQVDSAACPSSHQGTTLITIRCKNSFEASLIGVVAVVSITTHGAVVSMTTHPCSPNTSTHLCTLGLGYLSILFFSVLHLGFYFVFLCISSICICKRSPLPRPHPPITPLLPTSNSQVANLNIWCESSHTFLHLI